MYKDRATRSQLVSLIMQIMVKYLYCCFHHFYILLLVRATTTPTSAAATGDDDGRRCFHLDDYNDRPYCLTASPLVVDCFLSTKDSV